MKSTGGARMTVDVTAYERPYRLESEAHVEGRLDIRGAVTFEAIPDGTLMSWEWDVLPRGFMKLLGPFIARMGRRNEERIWTSLKHLLEGEESPATSGATS